MQPSIGRATPEDADEIFRLLAQNQLPLDGLRDHLGTMLIARQDGHIVGTAGLEVHQEGALLRSVAVAAHLRGRGLGQALTDAALRLAQELRVPGIYLLTTTAEGYFPKFGFTRIARAEVPATLLASIEFVSACPTTAVVMRKVLPL